MEIISTELRLKDIEWVEKKLEGLKKRPLSNTSLADKARKEEIATVEKVLDLLAVKGRDVRKGEWTNKEVSGRCCTVLFLSNKGDFFAHSIFPYFFLTLVRARSTSANTFRFSALHLPPPSLTTYAHAPHRLTS